MVTILTFTAQSIQAYSSTSEKFVYLMLLKLPQVTLSWTLEMVKYSYSSTTRVRVLHLEECTSPMNLVDTSLLASKMSFKENRLTLSVSIH